MPENIRFAMLADIHDAPVLRIELPNGVVSRHAAILAESGDDLVL